MAKKAFLVCGISNKPNDSENHLIQVQEDLPSFEILYGEDDDEDPLASSDTGSSDDNNDDGSDSDDKASDHIQ